MIGLNGLCGIEIDAKTAEQLLLLLPLVPLAGALLIASFFCGLRRQLSGWVAFLFAFASFVLTLVLFLHLLSGQANEIAARIWPWFRVGELKADFALRFDRLSAVMCMIVTGVGTVIHLYSIGYMDEDECLGRFFACFNLFLFAMLALVLGSNLLTLFVGWEGVGLCSYLLIGFWYEQMSNAEAGQKAFVVNRIGDAAFLLGILLLFWSTKSLELGDIEKAVPALPRSTIEIAALLLLLGAIGKSAQMPLYVWLPDAMAGPTPVSALIHAATMVTAGVYMIARLNIVYSAAPAVSALVAVVGAVTALFAATVAVVQYDIKRVLAYSTISQLGFMFMALGVGAYSTAVYHIVTHAFFKALLFLAAGSVIIGCYHEQDMRKLGGLWQTMAISFSAYLFGAYALAGLPYSSGYYSKDRILWAVYTDNGAVSKIHLFGGLPLNKLLFIIGLAASFLTALYITRSLILTFLGNYRGRRVPEESKSTMLIPLGILMAPAGLFGLTMGRQLVRFLRPLACRDLNSLDDVLSAEYHRVETYAQVFAFGGLVAALVIYLLLPGTAGFFARYFSLFYRSMVESWWVEQLYTTFVLKPLRGFAQGLFQIVDQRLVDGTVDYAASFIDANGQILSKLHYGQVGGYLLSLLFFLLCFVLGSFVL